MERPRELTTEDYVSARSALADLASTPGLTLDLDIVAGVLVGLDRLAALAGPFDWAAQFLRREEHQPMLGILPALGAEPAADIAGDDPDPAFRNLENSSGERLAHPMRVLHIGI